MQSRHGRQRPRLISGTHPYHQNPFLQRLKAVGLRSLTDTREAGTLVVQAVVEKGERTEEGDLVVAVLPVWDEIIRLIEKDPKAIYQIDPRKWEEILAGSYKRYGFDEVTLTPRSGDHGRDIIAVKHGFWSVRVIESVKRYKPGHIVPADDVRALLGVLGSDRNAAKGVVSTTSDFAPKIAEDPFISPYLPHRLELVNGERLIARLTSASKG